MISGLFGMEAFLLGVLILDAIIKVVNHKAILRLQDPDVNQRIVNGKVQKQTNVHPLFNSGFIELDNEPILSTATIVLDLILIAVMILFFVIELKIDTSISYPMIMILLTSRFYLRLPFTIALIIHQYKLRLNRIHKNLAQRNS